MACTVRWHMHSQVECTVRQGGCGKAMQLPCRAVQLLLLLLLLLVVQAETIVQLP